jgi:hypothetical protein
MGNTWTVTIWVQAPSAPDFPVTYHNQIYWQGEDPVEALAQFFNARETKSGCIKLEYRGANRESDD